MPIKDYVGDLRSVLDQAARVLSALIEIAADAGDLEVALAANRISQSLMQGRWFTDSPLLQLPGVKRGLAGDLEKRIPEGPKDTEREECLLRMAAKNLRALNVPKPAKAVIKAFPEFELTSEIEDAGSMLHMVLELMNKDTAKVELHGTAPLIKFKQHAWWVIVCNEEDKILHAKHLIGMPQRPVDMRFVCNPRNPPTSVQVVSGAVHGLTQTFPIKPLPTSYKE